MTDGDGVKRYEVDKDPIEDDFGLGDDMTAKFEALGQKLIRDFWENGVSFGLFPADKTAFAVGLVGDGAGNDPGACASVEISTSYAELWPEAGWRIPIADLVANLMPIEAYVPEPEELEAIAAALEAGAARIRERLAGK